MTLEEIVNFRRTCARAIFVLIVCFTVSFAVNVWYFIEYRSLRFFYNAAMISYAKAVSGVHTPVEMDALIRAVRQSNPKKLERDDAMVDFGFVKDSSGSWKTSGSGK